MRLNGPIDGKKIVNSFIGNLNRKYKSDTRGFMTIDPDVAIYAENNGFDVTWENNNDLVVYICKGGSKTRIDFDTCLIYQSVIWCGVLNLLDLLDYLDENVGDFEIVGCNTDAVYYHTDSNFSSFNDGFFNDKNYKINSNEYQD